MHQSQGRYSFQSRLILRAKKVSEAAGVSMPTAYKLVVSLEDLGILKEVTGAERNRLCVFKEYLNLFSDD
jgi:Fe2+ or Zn2+ uptake regulation protein